MKKKGNNKNCNKNYEWKHWIEERNKFNAVMKAQKHILFVIKMLEFPEFKKSFVNINKKKNPRNLCECNNFLLTLRVCLSLNTSSAFEQKHSTKLPIFLACLFLNYVNKVASTRVVQHWELEVAGCGPLSDPREPCLTPGKFKGTV